MITKFENLTQEQINVVIRIVREMSTFYITKEIESIMFGFSFITPKQFFNQPFGKTFDFETFESMLENCLGDYLNHCQYEWNINEEERCVFTVFKEFALPHSVNLHNVPPFNCEETMIEMFQDEKERKVLYEMMIG